MQTDRVKEEKSDMAQLTSGEYWVTDVVLAPVPKLKRKELRLISKLAAFAEATEEDFEGIRIPPLVVTMVFSTKNDAIRWRNKMEAAGLEFDGEIREYEGEILGKGDK